MLAVGVTGVEASERQSNAPPDDIADAAGMLEFMLFNEQRRAVHH